MFAASTVACVSHKTGDNEVGVLVCKVAFGCESKGVQRTVYPSGTTNFFAPFIRDFYTFDTRIQNLEMNSQAAGGDRHGQDDLEFKTTDGNDITMDVTVVWQIDPQRAPDILEAVGDSTAAVKEKVVRPMARTLVRDVLNELTSESIYNADKRFEKAEEARRVLAEAMAPYGVIVSQVILHEHHFHPEYEAIIHERKLSEQRAEQLKSEAEASTQGRPCATSNRRAARSRPTSRRPTAISRRPSSPPTAPTSSSSRTPRPSSPSGRPMRRASPSGTTRSRGRAAGSW